MVSPPPPPSSSSNIVIESLAPVAKVQNAQATPEFRAAKWTKNGAPLRLETPVLPLIKPGVLLDTVL